MAKDYKLKKFGPITTRRDYSNTVHNLPVTDLIAIQKESFSWFLKDGLLETFDSIYPIRSTNGRITIEFLPKTLNIVRPEDEFNAIKLAKTKGTTYSIKIYATLRIIDEETGETKEQEVLFGEIPMMTSGASFIINGSEKVIVSQLIRAAGPYYGLNVRPGGKLATDKDLFNYLEIIPRLGVWMDVLHKTTVANPDVKISINKRKLISLSVFLRSFGLTKDDILSLFGHFPLVKETLQKDRQPTENDCLEFVHGILRKGDRITEDSKKNLYANILFNKRRYNLSRTGRYMINKKLVLTERITDTILAEDLKAANSGKVLFAKGLKINFEIANKIQESFANNILAMENIASLEPTIYGAQLEDFPNLKERTKIISVYVYPTERWEKEGKEPVRIIGNDPTASEEHLLISDIIAALSYYFNFEANLGSADDKDSLENKRVVPIGELLQNQFQIALTKLERTAKERMSAREADKITPKNVTNNKSVYDQFKTFFNLSQLSQFMDQMNPLAEVSNKRRVTSLGPGGLNRETAKFDVRDVHTTHYGRICPIETPEGQNIGLILNFANYARINELGFIETPYFPVNNRVVDVSKPVYLSAADENGHVFGQSSIKLDSHNKIVDQEAIARKNGEYSRVLANEIEYIDVSSKQMTSVGASAIPFLENDDANRALMGANMQRQAVPLIKSEAPLVGTGIEADIAKYAATNLRADADGKVTYVDSQVILIKEKKRERSYKLRTFERSNQGSVISQKPLVKIGDKIAKGDLLTDGPAFEKGELAIGKNVVVAFTTWNGYNYEDAIIISEKLVKDDVYTSIHIEEKTIEFRKQKLGDDVLTNEIPNVSKFSIRNLDESGIIRVGSEVQTGDVLVGRVSPKGEDNPTPEEKLIAAIFFQKFKNSKDTSLKVAHGHGGTVINVEILSRENGDKLQDDVSKIVKVYIAQKRKIKVGDKMAGRHGNKGVISRVLPVEDMPHLEDGTPVDIMLNPQGVPSRMNIGQVLELHLGIAAQKLGVKFASSVFDGVNYQNINASLKEANLPENGKFNLIDPISGAKFASEISVGVMYMLKLAHMVDDKMHARSVGPYSLITQQPLGGKSQNGGQRFGEMETWAIEAYGATEVLQELLTYKSDNIDGRNKVYNALANGSILPIPGTPESFNVLAYELRGLGMKLEVEVTNKGEEK